MFSLDLQALLHSSHSLGKSKGILVPNNLLGSQDSNPYAVKFLGESTGAWVSEAGCNMPFWEEMQCGRKRRKCISFGTGNDQKESEKGT